MRADAARRRAELVRAARHLFAERGSEVALEAVADAAGVGIATLYRNFGSRTELADEVAVAILDDVRIAAETATRQMRHAPAAAWRAYVHELVGLELGALSAALAVHLAADLSPAVLAAQETALAGVDDVLAQARAAGLVDAELSSLELVLAIGLLTRPLPEAVAREAPQLVAHLTPILLGGMRSCGRQRDGAASP